MIFKSIQLKCLVSKILKNFAFMLFKYFYFMLFNLNLAFMLFKYFYFVIFSMKLYQNLIFNFSSWVPWFLTCVLCLLKFSNSKKADHPITKTDHQEFFNCCFSLFYFSKYVQVIIWIYSHKIYQMHVNFAWISKFSLSDLQTQKHWFSWVPND